MRMHHGLRAHGDAMPAQIFFDVVELLARCRFQCRLGDFDECDVLSHFQVWHSALYGVARFACVLPRNDHALTRIAVGQALWNDRTGLPALSSTMPGSKV